ncbi:hypothetical protein LIA77_02679 [Sarocladium implicatum]|nr:hypothetical protein LIA77_02679 [Sarocladium implicatum]
MTSGTIHSIEDLPLHLVAGILAQLGTIQLLKTAVSSHRIFRDAFMESTHSVAQAIILNQIPQHVLPFSLAFLASTRAAANDTDAVPRLIKGLGQHLHDSVLAFKTLADLSLSDYDFLSGTQVAIQSLGDMFCRETLPLFSQWFGSEEDPQQIKATAKDYFRIHRALYRYQILCNLFCNPTDPRSTDEDVIRKEGEMVMLPFAPWVNEQLLCVYYFIQRAVTKVYDKLAAHEIFWGRLSVTWSDEVWWTDVEEAPQIQGYLRHGLDFLDSVLRAETFDEKAKILQDSQTEIVSIEYEPHIQIAFAGYDFDWLNNIGISGNMTISQLHEAGMLKHLTGPLNGADGSTTSGPARTWLAIHADADLSRSVLDFETDGNLWMCGYVIWDAMDRLPQETLHERAATVRQAKPLFERYRRRWTDEQIRQSEAVRSDLSFAGARGYWPLDGIDFTGVRDLDEDRKQSILAQWRDGTAGNRTLVLKKD